MEVYIQNLTYLPRNCGGRGLLNVKYVVTTECQALCHYILSSLSYKQFSPVAAPEFSLSEFNI